MSKDQPKILIQCRPEGSPGCQTAEQGWKGALIPCTVCGVKVYVSDSTVKRIHATLPNNDFTKNPICPVCDKCGFTIALKHEVKFVLPTKEQMEEIEKLNR